MREGRGTVCEISELNRSLICNSNTRGCSSKSDEFVLQDSKRIILLIAVYSSYIFLAACPSIFYAFPTYGPHLPKPLTYFSPIFRAYLAAYTSLGVHAISTLRSPSLIFFSSLFTVSD